MSNIDHSDLNHILNYAKNDFIDLSNASLFLSGGTGFIGRWLLESIIYANQLLGCNIKVTVLSRSPRGFFSNFPHIISNERISFIEGDIRTFDFPSKPFTHAIHAATDVVKPKSHIDTFDVTINGTKRFLDFCVNKGVSEVLLLSSGAVYGQLSRHFETIKESNLGGIYPDHLNSAYGIGKLATEWLGTAYSQQYNLSCKSARIFAQVGPYLPLDKQFAAGNFILNVLKDEDILIKGDGSPIRSYMYSADLVIWLLRILVRGTSCKAYNVGSDHPISIFQLATLVEKFSANGLDIVRASGEQAVDHKHECYVPDITLARTELNLDIHIPIETAFMKTVEWYKAKYNKDEIEKYEYY